MSTEHFPARPGQNAKLEPYQRFDLLQLPAAAVLSREDHDGNPGQGQEPEMHPKTFARPAERQSVKLR